MPQVDSLKDQKRKLLAKGKASDKLMDEKLVRNESKLTSSQAEYLADRDQCCGRMLWTFREASGRLETVILRLMQFEDQLGKEVAAATVRFPAVSPPLLAPPQKTWLPVVQRDRLAAPPAKKGTQS